jgi:hypothetical protein
MLIHFPLYFHGIISIRRRYRKGFHSSERIYLPLETAVAMIRQMFVQVKSSPAPQLIVLRKLFHGPTQYVAQVRLANNLGRRKVLNASQVVMGI